MIHSAPRGFRRARLGPGGRTNEPRTTSRMDSPNSGTERSTPTPLFASRRTSSLPHRSFAETGHPLSSCDRAVLLTIIYADLFDFPLTAEEIYSRLVGRGFDRRAVFASLEMLRSRHLDIRREFVFLRGRHDLVSTRLARQERASDLWAAGDRYARWLSHVPFVRMVAVSGSLAVNNAGDAGDVDLFCITTARRLWLARLFIVPLSKLTRKLSRFFPYYLCANYLLSLDSLEVSTEEQNLFTAHEVLQAVPLLGTDVRENFLERNAWVNDLLPNLRPPLPSLAPEGRSRHPVKSLFEHALSGRLGDVLNRMAYRLFVEFYRRRARRRGWVWSRIAPAYQIERYTIPEGGYAAVVANLFRTRVTDIAAGMVTSEELETLFPLSDRGAEMQYDWDHMFRMEYGDGSIRGAA